MSRITIVTDVAFTFPIVEFQSRCDAYIREEQAKLRRDDGLITLLRQAGRLAQQFIDGPSLVLRYEALDSVSVAERSKAFADAVHRELQNGHPVALALAIALESHDLQPQESSINNPEQVPQ